jgi:serine/threonine-protein kinase
MELSASRDGHELLAGTVIGEYVVEGVIGRGGMGVVHAAKHPVIGKRVAIKVLRPELSQDPAIVRRFVDEARAVNRIGHPNIVDIFGFGALPPPDGRQYFVMELLEGEALTAALERAGAAGWDPPEARRLLAQACDALAAAHHEGIVHRDLKPDNLWLVRPRHGQSFLKLLDFGIAKLLEGKGDGPVTQSGLVIGTPQFMAPEQCLGEAVDHRADIYAFGVILYRIFTGRLPFAGKSFAEIVSHVFTVPPPRPSSLRDMPPGLEALILACLERDPARRPQSAVEVGARLEAALGRVDAGEGGGTLVAGAGVTAGAAVAGEPATIAPTRRRRPLVIGGLVAVAVGAAVGVAALALRGRTTPSTLSLPKTTTSLPTTTAPVATPSEHPAPPSLAPVVDGAAAPPAARAVPRGETKLGRKNPYQ